MTAFTLPCSCPDCGGTLVLVNSRATGATSVAILECTPCTWQYEVWMTLSRHARTEAWKDHDRELRRESKRRIKAREMANAS